MSIKPIDLQVMFANMSEASKDQAKIKEQSARLQDRASRIQVARDMEEDRRVTESPNEEQSPIIDDEESANPKRRKNKKRKVAESSDQSEAEKVSVLRDPDVGGHIDITG